MPPSPDIPQAVEVTKSPPNLPEQQASANAGQPEAQVAGDGIKKDARPALQILAEPLVAVQSHAGRVELRLNQVQLAKDITDLKQSDNPLNKAAGFDLEIASVQSNIAYLDQLEAKKLAPQSAVEAHRNELNSQLEQLRVQRGHLKGTDRQPIESQLGKLTASLTENGTEEEKQMAKNNPLGLIEKKYNQAIKDKNIRTLLFNSLRSAVGGSLSEDDRSTIDEQIEITDKNMDNVSSDNQNIRAKEIKGKLFKIGGLAALLPILMAWLASKKTQGGGGGMG